MSKKTKNMKIKENSVLLLNQHNLMITYGDSSVALYGCLLKKPVLLVYPYSKYSPPLLHDEKITTLCTDTDDLLKKIEESKCKVISKIDYQKYFEKFYGKFDGKSSERAANEIFSLIKKTQ